MYRQQQEQQQQQSSSRRSQQRKEKYRRHQQQQQQQAKRGYSSSPGNGNNNTFTLTAPPGHKIGIHVVSNGFVRKVNPTSMFYGRIQEKDKIVDVNGISLEGKDSQEILQIMGALNAHGETRIFHVLSSSSSSLNSGNNQSMNHRPEATAAPPPPPPPPPPKPTQAPPPKKRNDDQAKNAPVVSPSNSWTDWLLPGGGEISNEEAKLMFADDPPTLQQNDDRGNEIKPSNSWTDSLTGWLGPIGGAAPTDCVATPEPKNEKYNPYGGGGGVSYDSESTGESSGLNFNKVYNNTSIKNYNQYNKYNHNHNNNGSSQNNHRRSNHIHRNTPGEEITTPTMGNTSSRRVALADELSPQTQPSMSAVSTPQPQQRRKSPSSSSSSTTSPVLKTNMAGGVEYYKQESQRSSIGYSQLTEDEVDQAFEVDEYGEVAIFHSSHDLDGAIFGSDGNIVLDDDDDDDKYVGYPNKNKGGATRTSGMTKSTAANTAYDDEESTGLDQQNTAYIYLDKNKKKNRNFGLLRHQSSALTTDFDTERGGRGGPYEQQQSSAPSPLTIDFDEELERNFHQYRESQQHLHKKEVCFDPGDLVADKKKRRCAGWFLILLSVVIAIAVTSTVLVLMGIWDIGGTDVNDGGSLIRNPNKQNKKNGASSNSIGGGGMSSEVALQEGFSSLQELRGESDTGTRKRERGST